MLQTSHSVGRTKVSLVLQTSHSVGRTKESLVLQTSHYVGRTKESSVLQTSRLEGRTKESQASELATNTILSGEDKDLIVTMKDRTLKEGKRHLWCCEHYYSVERTKEL